MIIKSDLKNELHEFNKWCIFFVRGFLGGGGDGGGGGGSSKIIDIRMQEVSGIYVYKHNAVQMAWIIELCVDWTINSWKRTR